MQATHSAACPLDAARRPIAPLAASDTACLAHAPSNQRPLYHTRLARGSRRRRVHPGQAKGAVARGLARQAGTSRRHPQFCSAPTRRAKIQSELRSWCPFASPPTHTRAFCRSSKPFRLRAWWANHRRRVGCERAPNAALERGPWPPMTAISWNVRKRKADAQA